MPEIHNLMERWARWRHEDSTRHRAVAKTLIEKAREGMPSTKCTKCHGHGFTKTDPVCPQCGGDGRVKLKPEKARTWCTPCKACLAQPSDSRGRGEVNGRTCVPCRGRGLIFHSVHKVNPAFISSTFTIARDHACERIDRLVMELERRRDLGKYHMVVWEQYCSRNHERTTQAKHAARCGLNYGTYVSHLSRALRWIEQCLADSRRPHNIPFPWKPEKYEDPGC